MSSWAKVRRAILKSFAMPGTLILIKLRMVIWVNPSIIVHTRDSTEALYLLIV